MSEFTPGPWAYRSKEHDDWGVVRGPDGWVITQARAGRDVSEDELWTHRRNKTDPYGANARLIAAAPDLYAALKTAEAFIAEEAQTRRNGVPFSSTVADPYDQDEEFNAYCLDASAALAAVRAALAAADGRDVGAKP